LKATLLAEVFDAEIAVLVSSVFGLQAELAWLGLVRRVAGGDPFAVQTNFHRTGGVCIMTTGFPG
jgi:hypothetical protein